MTQQELKSVYIDRTGDWCRSGNDTERRLVFKNPKVRIGQGNHMWGAIAGVNYFCITWEV